MDVRKKILERFEQIIRGVGEAMECQVEIDVKRVTPAVINDDLVSEKVQKTAQDLLSDSTIDTAPYMTMGAEDMAFMQEKVPGCYFFIGSNNAEKHLDYGHHHPKFAARSAYRASIGHPANGYKSLRAVEPSPIGRP